MTADSVRTRPVPQRTCVGCNTATNKRELVRIVRTPEGAIIADPTGKKSGRGAYVHQQEDCWEPALKKGRLDRSLKAKLTPDDLRGLRNFAGAAAEESA